MLKMTLKLTSQSIAFFQVAQYMYGKAIYSGLTEFIYIWVLTDDLDSNIPWIYDHYDHHCRIKEYLHLLFAIDCLQNSLVS